MEWALDTDSKIFDGATEAEFLAKSIKDVSDHYSTGLLDQKQLDWANLIQCLAIIYGGRIFAIRNSPRPKVTKPATVTETARNFNQPAQHHRTAPPVNHFDNPPATNMEIPGIGGIDIEGHPLNFKNIN